MVYALQKFRHYLLSKHFKIFIDHYARQIPSPQASVRERICRWLLLFQEFYFEVIVKLGNLNA
jgi:hypothetical protein